MKHPRWETFRNVWWGLWLGVLIGMPLGVWIADRPGWKLFAGAISGMAAFVGVLPELINQILAGAKRFRSVSR